MPGIEVKRGQCLSCGLCTTVCPQGAVTLDEEQIAVIGDSCTLCGTCVSECPAQAITKSGATVETIKDLDVSHLAECRDVWVVTELRDGQIARCTFELLGEARRQVIGTRHKVAAVLLCENAGDYPQQLIAGGADIVYLMQNSIFRRFLDQPYKDVICQMVKEEKPLALLLSATAMGRSLAPRIAARLHTGLTADCTKLELCTNDLMIQTRPAFGGNLYASLLCPYTWPQMSTVRAKVMQPMEPDGSRTGKVIEKHYELDQAALLAQLIDYIAKENEATVDEAEIVVTAGFGAASDKGLALVKELAEVLGGALGSSRKVVDAGLLSYERQVGQTGKTVGPKLYVACGVSGAIQHLVGMSSSKTIIAINLDPDAPIFHSADIGIVADVYEFLPKLISALKARRAEA